MNTTAEPITKAEYARHRGCAKSAVTKAIAEGRITRAVQPDGRVDAAYADFLWNQNTRARGDSGGKAAHAAPAELLSASGSSPEASAQAPAAPPHAPAEPGYADFRARREKADAERAERENLRDAGKLIDRDQTERAIFDAFRALRDSFMAVSQRAAPKIVGMSDVREIELVLEGEVRKAFVGWEASMLEKLPAKEIM